MAAPGEQLSIALVDVLLKHGMGGLLRPWQIRRVARAMMEAEREQILLQAQTERERELIAAGKARFDHKFGKLIHHDEGVPITLAEIVEVSQEARNSDDARREINSTRAIIHAMEDLSEGGPTPEPTESIGEDWLFRWRENASEVSADELQNIWGRLLAGEFKAPGTFSLRTLDFVRNLSSSEAAMIGDLAQYVINGEYVMSRSYDECTPEERRFERLMDLEELGVITGTANRVLGVNYVLNPGITTLLRCNSEGLFFSTESPITVRIPAFVATRIGKEVFKLASPTPNHAYMKSVARDFIDKGCSFTYAKLRGELPSVEIETVLYL